MKYRDFGRTGIKVSEIGFGAWAIGGNKFGNSYGPTDDKISIEAINQSLELGCNFFDTADVYGYGHSEELLGKALKGKRDQALIATKVGADFYQGLALQNFRPDYIRFALEKSLERLATDYLDVYQLHNPPLKLIERSNVFDIFNGLKKDGKIRAWGISIFDPVEGLTALKTAQPDCLQVVYNIFSPRPAQDLFDKARESGCAIIAREPLANGFLTGKYHAGSKFEEGDIRQLWPANYIEARAKAAKRLLPIASNCGLTLAQLSLKFSLSHPAVCVAIPGIKTPEQAVENFGIACNQPLGPKELEQLNLMYQANFDL